MKGKLFIWISLTIIGFLSCEKSNDKKINSFVDTKWKLAQIIDESGETSTFPSDINDFEIIFGESGEIDMSNLCNYSYGNYLISDNDSLMIYNVGAGTEKYCLPGKSMDWETIFINSLITAETFSIVNKKFIINCQSNQLVFEY